MAKVSTTQTSWTDIILALIDKTLLDVNVCLPAKITAYDEATQYADVQIQLLQSNNGQTTPYPPTVTVPVKHPRANGGQAFIHMPLKPGDDVLLVFSQRSIDNWKSSGGMADPADPRKHHLTDAYALIGGSAIPDAFSPSTDDSIEIVNGPTKMIVHPDGKFQVINGDGEFVDTLSQITTQVQTGFQTLSEDTTNTIFGPTPLNSFAEYETIANELSTLLEMLESFKV